MEGGGGEDCHARVSGDSTTPCERLCVSNSTRAVSSSSSLHPISPHFTTTTDTPLGDPFILGIHSNQATDYSYPPRLISILNLFLLGLALACAKGPHVSPAIHVQEIVKVIIDPYRPFSYRLRLCLPKRPILLCRSQEEGAGDFLPTSPRSARQQPIRGLCRT